MSDIATDKPYFQQGLFLNKTNHPVYGGFDTQIASLEES